MVWMISGNDTDQSRCKDKLLALKGSNKKLVARGCNPPIIKCIMIIMAPPQEKYQIKNVLKYYFHAFELRVVGCHLLLLVPNLQQ